MPDSLRRALSSWRAAFSSERFRSSRTSDTPVATDSTGLSLSQEPFEPGCLGRAPRLSVKMRRFIRPEVPSVCGGHSCSRMSRCRFRVRSRDGFRDGSTLGAPSLAAPHAPLSRRRGYRTLDPRPRPSPRFAIFTRSADTRFSGSGSRPKTSATSLPTHGHALEHPILASSRAPLFAVTSKPRSLPPLFFRDRRPSPLEEGPRVLRAATVLPMPVSQRCKHAATLDSGSYCPIAAPLAGDASIRPSFAATAVWTTALDCTGRVALSEGFSLKPPAAAVRLGRKGPSSRELLEHPSLVRRRFFDRWAGCSHRPHESTKACVPAPPREG